MWLTQQLLVKLERRLPMAQPWLRQRGCRLLLPLLSRAAGRTTAGSRMQVLSVVDCCL